MKKPTIHLNGTRASELSRGYAEALKAVRMAIEKVDETAPNGRDYYPQGEHAIGVAVSEHQSRLSRLQAVREELYQLYESVEDQSS